MADNVTLPGSGEIVAADLVSDATLGPCKVQYIKLMGGDLDATDKIGSSHGRMKVESYADFTMAYEYDIDNFPIYIGEAYPGTSDKTLAVWRIRKLAWDGSGNLIDKQYGNGSTQFDQVWDDRASLSYA